MNPISTSLTSGSNTTFVSLALRNIALSSCLLPDLNVVPTTITLSRTAFENLACLRSAPLRSAPLRSESLRVASLKSAPFKSAPSRSALLRFAPVRLALANFTSIRIASVNLAPARLAPEKSAAVRLSPLKVFLSKGHFRRSAPGAIMVHGSGVGVAVAVGLWCRRWRNRRRCRFRCCGRFGCRSRWNGSIRWHGRRSVSWLGCRCFSRLRRRSRRHGRVRRRRSRRHGCVRRRHRRVCRRYWSVRRRHRRICRRHWCGSSRRYLVLCRYRSSGSPLPSSHATTNAAKNIVRARVANTLIFMDAPWSAAGRRRWVKIMPSAISLA